MPQMPNYQSPTSPSPQRYPQLYSILSTEEGFRRSIRYVGAADTALIIVLTIALLGLFYNIINTVQSLLHNGDALVPNFIAMFFEVHNSKGSVDPWFVATVWAPVIAVPVLIILLVVRRLTRPSSIAKVFDSYRQSGFLAELVQTGIYIRVNNNAQGPVYLIGAPNIAPDWVAAAVAQMNSKALSEPKSRECKAYIKAVQKVVTRNFGVLAVDAARVDPSLPQGLFITAQHRALTAPARIAVPVGNDFTQLKLYQLQKDVSYA